MTCCFKSSLGKKYLMALSGLGLMGFVLIHMLGNLQMFIGPDAVNDYAEKLKHLGPLLWVARLSLLGMLVIHVVTAVQLKIENKMARPVAYKTTATLKATLSSRTMALSGLVLVSYIFYHLMHFTWHWIDPSFADLMDARGKHDVYRMVVSGFSHPTIVAAYVVSMIFLGLHLHHGASSVFQSLGINNPRIRKITDKIGPVFSIVVILGYSSIPIGVITGIIH